MPTPLPVDSDVVALTRALCDVESVSGNETALANQIWRALDASPHLRLLRDGDAIVARTELGRPHRTIIAGHIDTVPVNDNLPTRIAMHDGQEVLAGRGTVDMKAGVAVQLKLAAELTNPGVDITWIWYDHEEVGYHLNGLGRLLARHPTVGAGDLAILCEPTDGRIEGGCNGNLRVELRTRGKRAHSARSWVGENAIHKLAGALGRLAAFQPATVPVDGLDFRESLSAVRVAGGVAGNVIPDDAVVEVNYRFAPDKSAADAIEWIGAFFADYDMRVVDAADGARPGLVEPLAQSFVRAVGGAPGPKYGWTDVARFSALGIPALNFGPGDPLKAHADDEYVVCAQIRACERALRDWLMGADS